MTNEIEKSIIKETITQMRRVRKTHPDYVRGAGHNKKKGTLS